MIYIISFFVNFLYVFLKGFQHKNVIGDHTKSAGVLAFFMGIMEVVSVTTIVKGGLYAGVSIGLGAAFGIVAAMKVHNRVYRKDDNARA